MRAAQPPHPDGPWAWPCAAPLALVSGAGPELGAELPTARVRLEQTLFGCRFCQRRWGWRPASTERRGRRRWHLFGFGLPSWARSPGHEPNRENRDHRLFRLARSAPP